MKCVTPKCVKINIVDKIDIGYLMRLSNKHDHSIICDYLCKKKAFHFDI